MKKIPLTKGKTALVDDEDYDYLIQFDEWVAIEQVSNYHSVWYAIGRVSRRLMHRIILGLGNGRIDKRIVDHRNHNGIDNRRCNIRVCTHKQNMWNSRRKGIGTYGGHEGYGYGYKPHKRYRGVVASQYFGYKVSFVLNGKRIVSEYFDCMHKAAREYNRIVSEHHGEFALLNAIPLDKSK